MDNQLFNCGNPECQNKVPEPTFCSDECRNKVYAPVSRPRRHWTLKEMQDWCKQQAERVIEEKRIQREREAIFTTSHLPY